jgi:hypothetical protein
MRIAEGELVDDPKALELAIERGLVTAHGALTDKGTALIDGIEPTACSGWHMGGAAPKGDWKAARRAKKKDRMR